MNQKTLINKILKLDYKSYDDYRFSCYVAYCSKYTEFGLPLQSMVTNKALYDWYCTQWRGVVEKSFLADNHHYFDAEILEANTYLDLLATYPKSIEAYYSSVILNMIKTELKPMPQHEDLH